jgi:hypothetical protein
MPPKKNKKETSVKEEEEKTQQTHTLEVDVSLEETHDSKSRTRSSGKS